MSGLKKQLEDEIFLAGIGDSVFNIADSIEGVINENQGSGFNDLWIYVDMMLG